MISLDLDKLGIRLAEGQEITIYTSVEHFPKKGDDGGFTFQEITIKQRHNGKVQIILKGDTKDFDITKGGA